MTLKITIIIEKDDKRKEKTIEFDRVNKLELNRTIMKEFNALLRELENE